MPSTHAIYLFLYVKDLDTTRQFYEQRLGLPVLELDQRAVKYDAGGGNYVGYTDFGEVSDQGSTFEAAGIPVSVSAALPISPVFAPYAKLGQLFWDAEGPGTTEAGNQNYDGDDTFYGVGARLGLSQAMDLRLEYERFSLDEADVDMASAALAFNF